MKDLRCLFRPGGGFDHILAPTFDDGPRQPWKHPGHKR
ncbi:hypothetical protein M2322_002706 [Rhodoblastus acidophilus]|nr:hypothetical protein [Rhodoblastus acidophilus]